MGKGFLGIIISGGLLLCGVSVSASAAELEEVIVTAQKHEQNANDIGMAITSFSGELLNELGVSETAELAAITPGLTYADSGGGTPVYTLRGVGFNESSLQSTATVGIYNDEIVTPFPIMTNGPLIDIARVEVLKGPQGTLYGRNTTGGAINYITSKPTDTFESSVTLGYGRFNTGEVEGYLSGPLSDGIRARFAFKTTQSSDGWQNSVSRDDKLGEKDKSGARLLVDADLNESVDALLSINWWRDKSDSLAPQAILAAYQDPSNSAVIGEFAQYWQIDPRDDNRIADWTAGRGSELDLESRSIALTLNWQIRDNLKLTSLTGYSKFEDNGSVYNRDGWGGAPTSDPEVANLITKLSLAGGYEPGSYLANGGYVLNADIDAFSQELHLTGETNNVTWVAGVYYSEDEVDSTTRLVSEFATNTNKAPDGGVGGFQTIHYFTNQKSNSLAAFGHAEWSISEATKLTVGLRQSRDEIDFAGCSADINNDIAIFFDGLFHSGAEQGGCFTLLADVVPFTSGLTQNSLDENSTSGKVAIDFNLGENTLVYLSYSRGFKSGSFPTLAATTGQQLNPVVQEELGAYEIGFKSTLFDNSVQLNGAAFYYDYKDKQLLTKIPSIFGSLFTLANIPESKVQGFELDLQVQPSEGLFVSAGVSYVDTEVKEFTGFTQTGLSPVDLAGSEFPFTPNWQFTGLANYERPVSDGLVGFIVGDVSYSGSSQADYASKAAPLKPIFKIDSYTLVGLRAGIRAADDTWSLSLWGRNIFDEFYATNILKSTDSIVRFNGMPATYGVTFSYNWF